FVFFSSRRRHARFSRDWSSDVCSSDLPFHSGTLANKPISRTRCLMDELWTTLPNARRVLQHAQDARPAWLWLQDGQKLIWANEAAGLFLAKIKKHGLKRAEPAVPIKGQIARIIRLGSPGRTSLARIQFRAGEKPVSATCATTPLLWEGEETALLIVGVDPIADDILAAHAAEQRREPEFSDTPEAEIPPESGMDAVAAEMDAIEAEMTAPAAEDTALDEPVEGPGEPVGAEPEAIATEADKPTEPVEAGAAPVAEV